MDHSKQIDISISVDDANLLLEALGQMPFVRVYHLINKIQSQAAQQLSQSNGDSGILKVEPEKKAKAEQKS